MKSSRKKIIHICDLERRTYLSLKDLELSREIDLVLLILQNFSSKRFEKIINKSEGLFVGFKNYFDYKVVFSSWQRLKRKQEKIKVPSVENRGNLSLKDIFLNVKRCVPEIVGKNKNEFLNNLKRATFCFQKSEND